MCCAFNAESALKKTTYSDLIQMMQQVSKAESNVNDKIKRVKTGEQNGLTLDCFCSGRDGICSWRLKIWKKPYDPLSTSILGRPT